MKHLAALALAALPTIGFAHDLTVGDAFVPLAAPGAMVHAAYMTLTNPSAEPEQIVSVSAQGYAMAHIHKSEVVNDVATMSMVEMIEISPGQTVMLEQGGLHIMLMKPESALAEGDTVAMTLEFADGTTQLVEAMVMPLMKGMHGDHSGHGS